MRRRKDPVAQRARRALAEAPDVLEAAARSLSGAPRSRAALTERLIVAGSPEELVHAAISRLVELGLIDDERLAQALIDSRDRSRQRGDRAIMQELRRRGIPDEIATRLMEQRAEGPTTIEHNATGGDVVTAGAEERAARAALLRVRLRGTDTRAETQRVAQMLARRGFPPALCWSLAREHVTNHIREGSGAGEAFDQDGGTE
jgi:regulatory protein